MSLFTTIRPPTGRGGNVELDTTAFSEQIIARAQ